MFESGAVSRCKYGIKILGKGFEKIKKYGPLVIEASDASIDSVKAVKE